MPRTYEASRGLEPGTYEAIVTSIEYQDAKFGEAAIYHFRVAEGEYEDVSISSMASLPASGRLGPKAKIRRWVEAILKKTFNDHDSIDIEAVIGCRCKVVVGLDETGTFPRILEVFPSAKAEIRANSF